MMVEAGFQVMASQSFLQLHGGDEAMAQWAIARLDELESQWSPFRADSDITRANLAAGTPVEVHPDTLAVVARGIEGWRQTGGLFDLTMLPAVLDVGYTASVSDHVVAPLVPGRVLGMTGFIGVDYDAGTLTVPVNAAIDLGGIGKGMAADIVAEDGLSPAQRAERGSYVGCIAGALSFREFRTGLAAVGLTDVEVVPTHQVADGMHSAIIRATKPA